jgi:hypothetical protein
MTKNRSLCIRRVGVGFQETAVKKKMNVATFNKSQLLGDWKLYRVDY